MSEFQPVRTMAELALLDEDEVLLGYREGLDGAPEPGSDKSRSYWHGWRNAQVDRGFSQPDSAQCQLRPRICRPICGVALMLRRSPLQRKTPMARTSVPIKRRAPKKRPGYHDPKYLTACRGEPCYLELQGICRGERETVVPCHANWSAYGKGMGIKARDIYTVPGCWRCHHELDQGFSLTDKQKRAAWEWAYNRWLPVRDSKLNEKVGIPSTRQGETAGATNELQGERHA